MKKNNKQKLYIASCLLAAFHLWTLAIQIIDLQAIGPRESSVGLATINKFIHNLTGVHMFLYTLTDWLGLVPIGVAFGFAIFGLVQWIKKKHIKLVDFNILALGGFYTIVIAAYVAFEIFTVNYRPVLINGYLEASYPSSTTMLVMCVMPTAIMQFNARIKNHILKHCISYLISCFIIFMVLGRLISGVHWFSDIVGGILLSAGLVTMYATVCDLYAADIYIFDTL